MISLRAEERKGSETDLTEEQKAKLKSCKSSAERMSMLIGMEVERAGEPPEAPAGGMEWYACPTVIENSH